MFLFLGYPPNTKEERGFFLKKGFPGGYFF